MELYLNVLAWFYAFIWTDRRTKRLTCVLLVIANMFIKSIMKTTQCTNVLQRDRHNRYGLFDYSLSNLEVESAELNCKIMLIC
jgi:hypothetical protein